MIFDKKEKKVIEVDGKKIELEQRPSFLSFLVGKKPPQRPAQAAPQQVQQPAAETTAQQMQQPQQPQQPQKPGIFSGLGHKTSQQASTTVQKTAESPAKRVSAPSIGKPNNFRNYLESIGANKKGLEIALKAQGVKTGLYEFVRNMLIASIAMGIVIGATMIIVFQQIGLQLAQSVVIGGLLGGAVFYMAFQTFLNFPTQKGKTASKNIERDILFAARDMIISLRSGMPLFNAITSISTGYGDASKEFGKIVEKVQLGTPLEDAIDQTVSDSKSVSFRRIMLQAAVSIRAGADVVSALQSVIDQLSQERIIELRRYGQRLNAIAMFYMLFGIILPSMGIAVVTILTTFIAIFTVDLTVLEFALVGIIFLQIVFLEMITSSRPVFSL